ncbi:sodium/hydrogen exchanger 2 isoform X1 [Prunus yedoensis var. nudiflora]|uniref:Sodium/hydrogen exchanger 2 isoform X1 n=1 Tax=Prunus yedoensis var. nudiflora TaxID=2094558 RepID=A0A315AYU8_PRUYE|nr:sodium/hydrogen exchanger 2 isoform X1 [Prunus yedoensis var. nudiflora]
MTVDVSSLSERSVGMLMTSDHTSVVSMNLFVALLCACILLGHLLEESRWMNESITALAIGLCTGVIILLTTGGKSSHLLVFSEDLFFIYLLPPIIFNAGFQVKKKQFFRNFMTIMTFGAVGTLISFAIISLGAMHFFHKFNIGSLKIGDYLVPWLQPLVQYFLQPILFAPCRCLIRMRHLCYTAWFLGKGWLMMPHQWCFSMQSIQSFDLSHINTSTALQFIGNFLYLFAASTILGVVAGLLSAYIIKKLYFGRHSTDREVALMILMAYLSYILSELFYLSAILTVFFCGIVMSHYTWHNVTESSRVTTKHTFATLSFVAEIFIFLYVGMDALDIEKWRFVSDSPGKSIAVSSILLALVLVGRAASVFPLSFLTNLTKKSPSDKISLKQQVTIWWAGLMRGSVSMALAYNQFTRSGHTDLRANAIMITSTITVVLFSTVVFGLMTKPLVRILLPSSKHIGSMISSEPSSPKSITVPLLSNGQDSEVSLGVQDSEANHGPVNIPRPTSLRMLLSSPTHTVHHYWRKFDNAFMRPVFGGRGFVPYVPGSPVEQNDHQWH